MPHLVEEQSKQYHFSKFELEFIEHFNQFGISMFEVAVQKGGWKKDKNLSEAICLIHAQLSKAVWAIRKVNPPHTKISDLSEAEVALAEVNIRKMDLASKKGLRVGKAHIRKHHFNKNSPFSDKHFEF